MALVSFAQKFHFRVITLEMMNTQKLEFDWARVPWDDPKMVSVLVMRHPLDRCLSGDGRMVDYGTALALKNLDSNGRATSFNFSGWLDGPWCDNYALRILSNHPVSKRQPNLLTYGGYYAPVTKNHLAKAKSWITKVTVLLDQACLSSSLKDLFKTIGWDKIAVRHNNYHQKPVRQLIGNDTLYERLVRMNQYDIELYEWSKKKTWIQCA